MTKDTKEKILTASSTDAEDEDKIELSMTGD